MTEQELKAIEATLEQREGVEWFDPARRGIESALIGEIPALIEAVRTLQGSIDGAARLGALAERPSRVAAAAQLIPRRIR